MHRDGPIPTAVWIALIALGVIGADFFVLGLAGGDPLEVLGGVACGGLLWALARGARWVHALTLAIIAVGSLSLLFHDRTSEALVAVVITAWIWIPLLVHSRWFWHSAAPHEPPTAHA